MQESTKEAEPLDPRFSRWGWAGLEILTCIGVALLFTLWAGNVDVNPMDRVGQVSGLAALQFRFAVVAAVMVVMLVLAHRFLTPCRHDVAVRLGCAAVAGLATGLVAGGIDVALRDTPFGLWAGYGDYGWINEWAGKLSRGEDIPDYYPPMSLYLLIWWSEVSGRPVLFAVKELQLLGTALYGPAAYLAWRMTLRPVWALGIGVVAMLPLIQPQKPYPQLTLVVLLPVLVAYLGQVRRADESGLARALRVGATFGLGIGVLFLLYSGWFVWCAAGAVAAFCLVVPWRRGWRQTLVLAGSSVLAFTAVAWVHLRGLLVSTGGMSDTYSYFDTATEPTYFAMWRNDLPADVGSVWPPLGELGHVSLFPLLLALGLGVALWLGWRRTVVIAVGCFAASAWLMRMWLASESYATQTVRLYPRTTMILLYCMLILTGFGVFYAVNALRRFVRRATTIDATGVANRPKKAVATVPVGLLLIPLLFVLASSGSATVDHYMPELKLRGSFGYFARVAHLRRLPNGQCPKYGRGKGCKPRTAQPGGGGPSAGDSREAHPGP
jgi:galactan 5-O-arabinofuranosyltransferase